MTDEERQLARIRRVCEVFHAVEGADAHSPAGMRARSTLWAITGKKPSLATFEEALTEFDEWHRIDSNRIPLTDGEREAWPNESDYHAIKGTRLQKQSQTITAKVQALLGDKTP